MLINNDTKVSHDVFTLLAATSLLTLLCTNFLIILRVTLDVSINKRWKRGQM